MLQPQIDAIITDSQIPHADVSGHRLSLPEPGEGFPGYCARVAYQCGLAPELTFMIGNVGSLFLGLSGHPIFRSSGGYREGDQSNWPEAAFNFWNPPPPSPAEIQAWDRVNRRMARQARNDRKQGGVV